MTRNEVLYYLLEHFPRVHEERHYKEVKCFLEKWEQRKTMEVLFVVMRLTCSVWFEVPEVFTEAERRILESERRLFEGLGREFSAMKGRTIVFLPDIED